MKKLFKILFSLILFVALFYIFLLYHGQQEYKVDYGISFNKQHSESLGLNWQDNFQAMLDDLQPKYLRFSATWKEVATTPDEYDFTDIDWQMNQAIAKGVKVTLVVGQKAPRWPECHTPDWVDGLSDEEYKIKLLNYVQTVIERYKDNPALDIWQVENEAFIKFRFGECNNFKRDLVYEEINLVKQIDPNHKIMITDSGELSTWQDATKVGDIFGSTLYRVVMTPSGGYWNYDWLPAGFYKLKAQFWGVDLNNFYISELQAEPWFTNSDPNTTDVKEQEKSMNIDRLKVNINYVKHIGVKRAYFWGVEWWYWMKEKMGDSSYWDLIKNEINS